MVHATILNKSKLKKKGGMFNYKISSSLYIIGFFFKKEIVMPSYNLKSAKNTFSRDF
jgi:hypothetical protein